MATIRHKRIQLLQGFTPRLIDPEGEALIVTPTTATINVNENASAQLIAQNTVTLSAICVRSGAVINWTASQGTLSSSTGTTVTLTYSTVPVSDFSNITVTATTSADTRYLPSTLTKTATISKVLPAQTSVELTLYQRSASAPVTLPSAATYNTSTKALAGTLNGWLTTIPAGTDPLYATKATILFYAALTNFARAVTGWLTATKLVENGTNGTNGSDATVNMANLKLAIEANSSTVINIANSSTLFKTATAGNGGVFIGGGGLYGKDSAGTTTFAIDGSLGAALFRGLITGDSTLLITGAASTSLLLYGLGGLKATYTTCAAFNTSDTLKNMGLVGLNQTPSSTGLGIGVYGEALGSSSSAAGVAGFGFYGMLAMSTNTGGVGLKAVGGSSTGYAMQVTTGYLDILCTNATLNTSGNMTITGSFTALGNVTAYSDKAIKTYIRPISLATSKLKQINGYQYKNLLANKHDCGIIAQEIEKILPELVLVSLTEYEGSNVKTVNYNGVVALLVAANRELIARIEALEAKLK